MTCADGLRAAPTWHRASLSVSDGSEIVLEHPFVGALLKLIAEITRYLNSVTDSSMSLYKVKYHLFVRFTVLVNI